MTLANRDYQEKRNYIRMKVETPVEISIVSENQTLEGTCKDLSGGGLLVELAQTLPVGTTVEISIASKHGHNPMLKANAVVSRIVGEPSATSCLIGMEIDEVLN